MEQIKLTVKQVILNFKYLFSSYMNIIFLLLPVILVSLTVPTFLFSINDAYGITVCVAIMTSLFVLYNGIVYQFRNSTLYNQSQLTKNNKWIFNLSSLMTLFIVGISIYIIQLFILQFMAMFGFLARNIVGSLSSNITFRLFKMPMGWNFYWASILILICFSFSFFVSRVIKSSKGYFIVTMSLIILTIIFGATFNDYFKSQYTFKDIDGEELRMYIYQGNVKAIFPEYMYIPSLLFPVYAPAQMFNKSGCAAAWEQTSDGYHYATGFFKYGGNLWTWQEDWWFKTNGLQSTAWRWNILYFVPYFHIVGWFGLGMVISKFKKI